MTAFTYTGTSAAFVELGGNSLFVTFFATGASFLETGGNLYVHQYWGAPAVFTTVQGISHIPYSRGLGGVGADFALSMGQSTYDANTTIFPLNPTWKFQLDPDKTGANGIALGWHTESFDDSSWGTLQDNATWESQGVVVPPAPNGVAGSAYGWYRQKMTLPVVADGKPLTFTLAPITGDDVMYFNGVRIGGRRGNFQYTNNLNRMYTVPASVVHQPPAANTLAVRCWGGYLSQRPGSGLEGPGAYNVLATKFRPHARLTGGSEASEVPLEAFDMSPTQAGLTWELVIRLQTSEVNVNPASIAYLIFDFYNQRLAGGEAPVNLGADGIYRGVISINAALSRTLYFAGRFIPQWAVIVPGSSSPLPDPSTWVDTGLTITTANGGYTMEVWSHDYPAGTIQLPAQASGTFTGMYNVVFPTAGVVVSNLVVHDTANAAEWALATNLQVGNLVSAADYPYTISAMSGALVGAPTWIQTGVRSKSVQTNPIASVDIDRPTTVYIAVDKRVTTLPWNRAVLASQWIDTGDTIVTATGGFTEEVYSQAFDTGTIFLPAQASGPITGMYNVFIPDPAVVVSNLVVNDPTWASSWSIQSNLQVGSLISGDEIYTFSSIPAKYIGGTYIESATHSKSTTNNPLVQFDIDRPTTIYIGVDRRVTTLPWTHSWSADHLRFDSRDTQVLAALSTQFDSTPYGSLKLNDIIDCSTSLTTEVHPYMQSSFNQPLQHFMTPGAQITVPVNTILGKQAREPAWGWFAYKIGRGGLDPNKTYLLRVEYPEDVPRYGEVTIQCGTNRFDVGWQNGFGPGDVYEPWPLSGAWQFFDILIPLGVETTDSMGAMSGSTTTGVWVYILNKVLPGSYWNIYSGGPAVATLRLYEIDPVANAPQIQLPSGLPHRVMTFDWERECMVQPANICSYGKLMGYSAVSPISTIKWNTTDWSDPRVGYDNLNVDYQNYYVNNKYIAGSNVAPVPSVPGKPSVHAAFIAATAAAGIDYIPRYEYGGSIDLQTAARSINASGAIAVPDRYETYGVNVLHPDAVTEVTATFDGIVAPYSATNPQFKGILWRQRSDRMQISYGSADATLYSANTGTPLPVGFATMTPAQVGQWCAVTQYPAYANWWHGKRRDFHQACTQQLKSYRSDLILYYMNWETDKFSILLHDRNSGGFYADLSAHGAGWYATEATTRAAFTAADYTNALEIGDFSSAVSVTRPDNPYPDYGLRPSLYNFPGMMLLAPVNNWCYAQFPDYVNYFQTFEGLAASNMVPYDEIAAGFPNQNYAGTMVTPAGGPFSMAMEVMSYFHGDAKMLTWTPYTFGRGFADAHRRFAQAFLALPAVAGTQAASGDPDVAVRTYHGLGSNTYVGVAHKGFAGKTINLSIPGTWPANVQITNLVTNQISTAAAGSSLPLSIASGPMELNSFFVRMQPPSDGQPAQFDMTMGQGADVLSTRPPPPPPPVTQTVTLSVTGVLNSIDIVFPPKH